MKKTRVQVIEMIRKLPSEKFTHETGTDYSFEDFQEKVDKQLSFLDPDDEKVDSIQFSVTNTGSYLLYSALIVIKY